MQSVDIILEGFLRKSPPQDKGIFNKLESWRNRWFVLFRRRGENHCELFYYTSDDKRRCKGSVRLDTVESVTVAENDVLRNVFVIHAQHKNKERKYTMIAASDEERKKWVSHLVVACGLDEEANSGGRDFEASQGSTDNLSSESYEKHLVHNLSQPQNSSAYEPVSFSSSASSTTVSTLTTAASPVVSKPGITATALSATVSPDPSIVREVKPEIPAKAGSRVTPSTDTRSTTSTASTVLSSASFGDTKVTRSVDKVASTHSIPSSNTGNRNVTPSGSNVQLTVSPQAEEPEIDVYINSPVQSTLTMPTVKVPHASLDNEEEEEGSVYVNTGEDKSNLADGVYNSSPSSAPLVKTTSVKGDRSASPPVLVPRRAKSTKQNAHDENAVYNTPNASSRGNADTNSGLYNAPRNENATSVYKMPKAEDVAYNVPQGVKITTTTLPSSSVSREGDALATAAFDLTTEIEGETEFGFFEARPNVTETRDFNRQSEPFESGDYVNANSYASDKGGDADSTYINASALPSHKNTLPSAATDDTYSTPSQKSVSNVAPTLTLTEKAEVKPSIDLSSAPIPEVPVPDSDSKSPVAAVKDSAELEDQKKVPPADLKKPAVQFPASHAPVSHLARAQTELSATRKAGWMAPKRLNNPGSPDMRQLSVEEAPPLPSRIVAPPVGSRLIVSASFRRVRPAIAQPFTKLTNKSNQENNEVVNSARLSFQNARPALLTIPARRDDGLSESDESVDED